MQKSESILPNNDTHWHMLRLQDVTSTEVSSLFNLSPYLTSFELWHRKKSATPVEIEKNSRMKWGSRLEESIAKGASEEQGWIVRRMLEYVRLPEIRLGASFDYCIQHDGSILEIKNVDSLQFERTWAESSDGIEAPPHIEMQVQCQLAVSQRERAFIAVLIGGNRLEILERPRNEFVIEKIKEKVSDFWKSIEDNKPPEPNFQRDAAFIASLYRVTDPDLILDATTDPDLETLARKHFDLGQNLNSLMKDRDAVKAEVLTKIGKAEKVFGDGWSISAGAIAETTVDSFIKKASRGFRVYIKKVRPD